MASSKKPMSDRERKLVLAVVVSLVLAVGGVAYSMYNNAHAQSRWRSACAAGLAAACEGYIKGAW